VQQEPRQGGGGSPSTAGEKWKDRQAEGGAGTSRRAPPNALRRRRPSSTPITSGFGCSIRLRSTTLLRKRLPEAPGALGQPVLQAERLVDRVQVAEVALEHAPLRKGAPHGVRRDRMPGPGNAQAAEAVPPLRRARLPLLPQVGDEDEVPGERDVRILALARRSAALCS
jgi:hypothetical protein